MTNSPTSTLVAGTHAGIKVHANGTNRAVIANMQTLANGQNYSATIAMQHLRSLSSGHLKSNVYIKEGVSTGGLNHFVMVLPGCKIKVVKRSNGELYIYHISHDDNYENLQKEGDKPALFKVKKNTYEDWDVEFIPSGAVTAEKNRVVCIADAAGRLGVAAESAASAASDSPIGGARYINTDGFDMHYTPGEVKIGGLVNIKQAMNASSDGDLRESATLLAEAMYRAKDITGVNWISERGGCGVLTQAMQILKNRGVNLSSAGHFTYLSHPTTSVRQAQALAADIGLKFERSPYKVNPLRPSELIGGLGVFGGYAASVDRYRTDESHTSLKLAADLAGQTMSFNSAAKTVGVTSGAVLVALGLSSGGSVPAATAFAAAVGALIPVGTTLTEAYLPRIHNKIKGKF